MQILQKESSRQILFPASHWIIAEPTRKQEGLATVPIHHTVVFPTIILYDTECPLGTVTAAVLTLLSAAPSNILKAHCWEFL